MGAAADVGVGVAAAVVGVGPAVGVLVGPGVGVGEDVPLNAILGLWLLASVTVNDPVVSSTLSPTVPLTDDVTVKFP